jgi:peptidyl-prolyl cis-trans isomerase C
VLTRQKSLIRSFGLGLALIAVLVGSVACSGASPTSGPTAAPNAQSVPTATLPPVASQQPSSQVANSTVMPALQAAAIVNGQAIPMGAYQEQVSQFQAALVAQGLDPNSQDGQAQLAQMRQQVLDNMIDDVLIAQAAAKEGVSVSDADLDAAMQKLIADAGGQVAFEQSLVASGQTLDEARALQRTQMLNNLMRDRVLANVPTTAEQVHARHILVDSEATAQALLAQIQAGADFAQLAKQASQDNLTRDSGGDLGWFPRGVLVSKEVEDAAFALQPGQVSGVVHSAFGYHIVQVIERDPARQLDPEQLLKVQQQAVEQWLAGLRDSASVQRLAVQ